jgi:hypothetical protein
VWPTHPALTASRLSATFPRSSAQRKSIDVARVRNLLVFAEVDPFMKISWLRFPRQAAGQLEAGGDVSVKMYQQLTQTMSLGCDSKIHEKLTKGT